MASEIKGYKCPGCGRHHKAPQGFAAMVIGVDFARDGERDVSVITQGRRVMDGVGAMRIVVERVVRLENGRAVEIASL